MTPQRQNPFFWLVQMRSSLSFFLKFISKIKSRFDFVNFFIKTYIFLLGLGVLEYSTGYDLYNFLSITEYDHFYIKTLRALIYLTCFLSVFSIFPLLNLTILIVSFCTYEFLWGSGLVVYTTNAAAPVLTGIFIYFVVQKNKLNKSADTSFVFFNYILSVVGIAYLTSGLNKIFSTNSGWLTGEALRAYFYESLLFEENVFKVFLLNRPHLLQAISFLIIFWEISFIFCIISGKKIKAFFMISGLLFHAVIYIFLGPNFFYFFVPCYLAFIPYFYPQRRLYENA